MTPARLLFCAAIYVLAFAGSASSQAWQKSPVNGHWYSVAVGSDWFDLRDIAESWGGHLATVRNQEEHDWVANSFPVSWIVPRLAIGLYQDTQSPEYSEPSGGWKWHSGEPITFTAWTALSDATGTENYAYYYANFWPVEGWLDDTAAASGFGLVEVISDDCDENGLPDLYELAAGLASDLNGNGLLDACETDCNGNGVADILDLQAGTSADCNANDVPDECDISSGTSLDLNLNGTPDECDVGSWQDLGLGLAGSQGIPALSGTGTLAPNDPITLQLENGKAFSTATLIVGFSSLNAPFKGGVLVPSVDIVFTLTTDFFGAVTFGGPFPTGVPQGFVISFQYWIQDPLGTAGFAASNALAATAP